MDSHPNTITEALINRLHDNSNQDHISSNHSLIILQPPKKKNCTEVNPVTTTRSGVYKHCVQLSRMDIESIILVQSSYSASSTDIEDT